MKKRFTTLGLIARLRSAESAQTARDLLAFLERQSVKIVVESATASLFAECPHKTYARDQLGQHCDLAIVVGGDGSMLNAARAVVDYGTPVLGINRGRLGFLTDIHPNQLAEYVQDVLSGHYIEESRFLLSAEIYHNDKVVYHDIALNDVVLLPGDYAHMIEFDIHVNRQLVCHQRADGQIIATPTGSTAYALSGGGPILHPHLNAIVLVPMFPHTLSSRPIVLPNDAHIEISISPHNENAPSISCDGQQRVSIAPGDKLMIRKKNELLLLLHPSNYNYYETLRSKLHWQTKLSHE